MRREQNGTIILRSGKWYASYWEQRNVNGTVERKRVTHYLGEKTRGKKTTRRHRRCLQAAHGHSERQQSSCEAGAGSNHR